MRRCAGLQKQTVHPPKKIIPLAANPLTRWSLHLPKWAELGGVLTPAHVGLEGCHCAFNATNSIRTCLYFQTASPPRFLTAASWRTIEHMQVRDAAFDLASPDVAEGRKMRSALNSNGVNESLVHGCTHPCEDERAAEKSPFDGIAVFGEGGFFVSQSDAFSVHHSDAAAPSTECPLIALENFAVEARSIMRTRFPTSVAQKAKGIRLVVGHENWGVRKSLLRRKCEPVQASKGDGEGETFPRGSLKSIGSPVADMVMYVPQYGTISSLNVVTSLGIALFYCYMDAVCPGAREIHCEESSWDSAAGETPTHSASSHDELHELRCSLERYQSFFSQALPAPLSTTSESRSTATSSLCTSLVTSVSDENVNTSPRVDQRPLHPFFYLHSTEEIQRQQLAYREALLRYSFWGRPGDVPRKAYGERSTLSPLASPCFGLSVLYENEYDQRNFGGLIRSANAFLVDHIFYVGRRKINVVGAVGSYHYTPPVHLGPLPGTSQDWAREIHTKVQKSYGSAAPRNWWLLDCGHDFLYELASETPPQTCDRDANAAASSFLSLKMFQELKSGGKVHSLCDSEANLREATRGGLILLVPQEGKLPHPGLMELCTGILSIFPDGIHYGKRTIQAANDCGRRCSGHCGLPSQVASGIALQRLSAVLHPRLAAL